MAILALAIFGYFSYWPVLLLTGCFILMALIFLTLSFKNYASENLSFVKITCFVLIIVYVFIIGFFHHDLPTARDDLSYIYSADRLVQSHSLKWDDYFSRPVHGVRQLEGDTFTSQFLPAYVGYLAVYYLFGGLSWLLWANALLMLLTFGVIYYLTKKLAGEKSSLLAIIFFVTSYVFYWFPKRTNVENIFIFLILFGLWLLVEALDKKKLIYLTGGLVPFSLLILARAEGLVFFASFLVVAVIIFFKFRCQWQNRVSLVVLSLIAVIANFILFYFYTRFYQSQYIVNQLFDVFDSFGFFSLFQWLLLGVTLLLMVATATIILLRKKISLQRALFWLLVSAAVIFELLIIILNKTGHLHWNIYRSQYVLENFVLYFYFIYFFIIIFGLKKKIFSSTEFWMTAVMLPAFFFFIEPNIALDHPWFMRRFYPNIIPLGTILAAIVLARLNITKKQLKYLTAFIALTGLVLARPIILFVEHQGIRDQVEQFNAKFPQKNALILMNPGWSWQKIALLQHYFYGYDSLPNFDLYRWEESEKELPNIIKQYPDWEKNDADLVAIMNWLKDQSESNFIKLLNKYQDVYIVTNRGNFNYFDGFKDENLVKTGSYEFNYPELQSESNITGYIRKYDQIKLKEIREIQDSVPASTISEQVLNLDIYRVIDSTAYIPFEYVLEASQIQDENHIYWLLASVDLKNFRKDLRNTIKTAVLGNGE